MKKSGILHRDLARTIAAMGHGDLLIIGDAGLPVPPGVPCIDLAVTHGVPSFAHVLKAVLSELSVESCTIALEADTTLHTIAPCPPTLVSHADFKAQSVRAVAIVRTGEVTPFANIGLYAGVTF
jgi:D-ribose pyranase